MLYICFNEKDRDKIKLLTSLFPVNLKIKLYWVKVSQQYTIGKLERSNTITVKRAYNEVPGMAIFPPYKCQSLYLLVL